VAAVKIFLAIMSIGLGVSLIRMTDDYPVGCKNRVR
jgi:hypothetical protein